MFNTLISLDQNLFLFINNLSHPQILLFISRLLSGVGELGLIWIVLGIFLIYSQRHHPKRMIEILIGIILSSFAAVGFLKPIILRLRPEFTLANINIYTKSTDYLSFPSGHAAVSFSAAFILSRIYPKGGVYFYTLALLIALSRVYLGVHYPLDILAGGIIGIICGYITLKLCGITIKKSLATLVILASLLFYPKNSLAKTIMTIEEGKTQVFQEENVLGVQTGEEAIESPSKISALLDFKEKLVEIKTRGEKLLASVVGEDRKQEVDEIRVKRENNFINLTSQGGEIIIKDKIGEAKTKLPILISQSTSQIMAKSNNGEKIISYHTSEVRGVIANIDKFSKKISQIPVSFELKENGAKIEYVASKTEDRKFLGLIPIKTNITTTVSAETGEVESEQTPWLFKALSVLFF